MLESVRLPIPLLALVVALLTALRSTIRSRTALAAEIPTLRHQFAVLGGHAPRRLRPWRTDRLVWVWLSRAWSEWRHVAEIVSPDAVVRVDLQADGGRQRVHVEDADGLGGRVLGERALRVARPIGGNWVVCARLTGWADLGVASCLRRSYTRQFLCDARARRDEACAPGPGR